MKNTPNNLLYARRKMGTTGASQSVVLTDTGETPLVIPSIGVTGVDTSSFVFTNGGGWRVATGATCSNHGHFTPATAGALTAAFSITDNAGDSPESVALNGMAETMSVRRSQRYLNA